MERISEDYVGFEIAKLLKEKRFDEKCRTYYKVFPKDRIAAIYHSSENRGVSEDDPNEILCPTLQMAMKWLREVHNTFISIIYENDGVFVANLKSPLKGVDCMIDDKHNCWFTYEEACEASIKYCLENLI